jgi:ApaG protein
MLVSRREFVCNDGILNMSRNVGRQADSTTHTSRATPPAAPGNTQKDIATMAESKKYEITVSTQTQYIPEQSNESGDRYVFAYTITIRNTGSMGAQLISRHWVISDSNNLVQEVRGLGVVGTQPLLKPDESFEYTSGTAITTPVGTMRGSYQMVAEDGTQFDAPVPEFTLSVPRVLH